MKTRIVYIILICTLTPLMMFAQKQPGREKACNTVIKSDSSVYFLKATTMRRWTRLEGSTKITTKDSKWPAARHEVAFTYKTTVKKTKGKDCVKVKRTFTYEWVKKNNLMHYTRVRRTGFADAGKKWDFKANGFFAGRKVKELVSVKDAASGLDYKILAFSGRFPFMRPGIVVLTETSSSLINDLQPIVNQIVNNKSYYHKKSELVDVSTWDTFPLR